MRVWVLTQGHYEDRTILGLFLDQNTAQQAERALTRPPFDWHPDLLDLVQEVAFETVNDFLAYYRESAYCPKKARNSK